MTILPWSVEAKDSDAKAMPEPLKAPTVDKICVSTAGVD